MSSNSSGGGHDERKPGRATFPTPPPPPPARTAAAAASTQQGASAASPPSLDPGGVGTGTILPSKTLNLPLPPPPRHQQPPPRSGNAGNIIAHTSTAPIPDLSSAPPSANLSYEQQQELMSSYGGASGGGGPTSPLQQQQQQQQHPTSPSGPSSQRQHHSGGSVLYSPGGTPTVVSSFPPPPPPRVVSPTRDAAAAAAGSSSKFTAPPPPKPIQPTIAPLPPPPIMKKTASTTSGGSSSSRTSGGSSFMKPLPPPPPSQTSVSQQQQDRESSVASSSQGDEGSATQQILGINLEEPPPKLPPTTFVAFPQQQQQQQQFGRGSHQQQQQQQPQLLLAKRQTHIPVLVIATEEAHKMAWKNRLRLTDMLEGLVQQQVAGGGGNSPMPSTSSTIPFRSATKSLHLSPNDVNVTFVEPDDLFRPVQDEMAQAMLDKNAQLQPSDGNLEQELCLLEDQVDNLLQEENRFAEDGDHVDVNESNYDRYHARVSQMEQVTKDAYALTSPTNIPWLWRFRIALDASTDNMPHELSQAPPVVLLVATTAEGDDVGGAGGPVETLQHLANNSHYLPLPYHNGLLDLTALRQHAWVLHDNVDGPSQFTNENTLRQALQKSFGFSSAILRINSISLETAQLLAQEEENDLWDGGGTRGSCLSVSDRVLLRKHLQTLVTATVLPALERRIADLNTHVQEKKRGVKNVLKSLWGVGSSSSNKASDGDSGDAVKGANVKYRFDSVESQARLLADTLFLLQDYDTALSTYRLIKDDFKHDQAHVHYASLQERLACCMYLTDPYGRAREIFSCMENALLSYSRAADEERPSVWGEKPGRPTTAPQATRLATRLCLILLSMKNVLSERALEVADLLASASSHETALGAAVLLEQSSSHYFKAELFRKYAFHVLMSGHMFRAANQDHHAFRCFTSALYIYRDSQWEELHNHLLSALAAQLYSMGRMASSLQLYAKLVGTTEGGRVSSKSQQKFINHLLEICNEHPKKALAGADRMAASSKLSGEQRDAVRKERLNRIVQVVRYTKSASRILELPNIDLPNVDDSTVRVIADSSASVDHQHEWIPSFGDVQRGSEEVWQELQLLVTAELKANDKSRKSQQGALSDQVASSTVVGALARIEDVMARKVIEEVDREKASRNIMERAKRSSNYKERPPVRAQMEPLEVEFSIQNPLAIPIDLVAMQLVARMTDESGDQICTNEDAIKITPLVSYDEKKEWTFQGANTKYMVPDFCRISAGPGGSSSKDPLKQSWKSADEVVPFFAVTKTSLSLEPESRRTISVSICPLARGNLEIVGVRCRLLDDVWVYHPFTLKGQLLQNTRSNRANRVRAEPMVLKAKVERGMPCLTSQLVRPSTSGETGYDESGPTLQGQISSWTLRLSNLGTAPAANVYLKTNFPWLYVTGEESEAPVEGKDQEALNCSIGPTGTLFQLPIKSDIKPGESVEVPVRIRASVSGRHEFYMLFRYELGGSESTSGSPRYRWLKKMFDVPVYPSISLNASVMPSFSNHSDHILSTEFTNNRTERPDKLELVVEKLSLASRCYRLESLPGQFSDRDGAKLGWQERITAHYRIVACEGQSSSSSCRLSECTLSAADEHTRISDAASSPLLNFLCLERAHQTFEQTLKEHQMALVRAAANEGQESQHPRSIAQIRRANTSGALSDSSLRGINEVGHPTSIARLCPPDASEESICLFCSWRSEDNKIRGEHYIRDLSVRPPTRAAGCPLTITAKHPQVVSTDFVKGPADVPLEITLRNRLVKEPVEFVVAMETPETFDFIGPECFKSALSGGEELSIPLRALIPTSGVYNLQKIRLTVEDEGQVSYIFPMQWMVTVNES